MCWMEPSTKFRPSFWASAKDASISVGIDAEAFEAETLVVGDGAFEVRGRNADMLDAGDGVANGHGDSSEQDGFAGIERQSHRENGVGVDYLPISAR